MCTLTLFYKAIPGYNVVAAMNRDERYSRPSSSPRVVDGPPMILAPRDEEAGGTWIGVNELGLFAALSNRHDEPFTPGLRSRGLLCLEALRKSSVDEVREFLQRETSKGSYNPFNLIYGDESKLFISYFGKSLTTGELEPGVHVLTNRDVDDLSIPKVRRVREILSRATMRELEDALRELKVVSQDHRGTGRQVICLHSGEIGTVSSSIVAIGERFPKESAFFYCSGNPCRNEYRDYSNLLHHLSENRA